METTATLPSNANQQHQQQPLFGLTDRETAVLNQFRDNPGATRLSVAQSLGIEECTVAAHLKAIYRKTGAGTRLQAVLIYSSHTTTQQLTAA